MIENNRHIKPTIKTLPFSCARMLMFHYYSHGDGDDDHDDHYDVSKMSRIIL